jgi:Rieske Fe-S protein
MDRKEFIRTCGYAGAGILGMGIPASCRAVKSVEGKMTESGLKIEKSAFLVSEKDKNKFRRSLTTRFPGSSFPLVIYRISAREYSAFLLRCTHQGAELSINGDMLSCAAHGSEFNKSGEVITGPADQPLQQYKVTSDENNIYIHHA